MFQLLQNNKSQCQRFFWSVVFYWSQKTCSKVIFEGLIISQNTHVSFQWSWFKMLKNSVFLHMWVLSTFMWHGVVRGRRRRRRISKRFNGGSLGSILKHKLPVPAEKSSVHAVTNPWFLVKLSPLISFPLPQDTGPLLACSSEKPSVGDQTSQELIWHKS